MTRATLTTAAIAFEISRELRLAVSLEGIEGKVFNFFHSSGAPGAWGTSLGSPTNSFLRLEVASANPPGRAWNQI
jgi:hypothetical protein